MVRETIKVDYKHKSGYITCSNPNTALLIRAHFSIENRSFSKSAFAAKRKYAITPIGAFQIGLWNEIQNFILSLGKPIDIQITPEFKKNYKPTIKVPKIQTIDGYKYYDYQENAIKCLLSHGRGIALMATSAGKTLCFAGLIKTILHVNPKARILITVPTSSLLRQTFDEFVDKFGFTSIERWGSGHEPTFEKNVLIAIHNSLWQDINYSVSKLENYDYVISDEAHLIGEKETKKNKDKKQTHLISKIIHNIKTPNKFGFTGTLPDSRSACWNIIGKIGPILFQKSSYEIRKQGTATDIHVNILSLVHSEDVPEPTKDIEDEFGNIITVIDDLATAKYNAERKFLYNSQKRNDIIRKLATRLEGNGMILIDNIEQGEILMDILSKFDKKVYFVRGSMAEASRKEIIQLMEDQTGIVCIAISKCFATGLSINNLHWLIFPAIGKSTVKIMQSLGRSMRLHESKDLAKVYDLTDNTRYSSDHGILRQQLYTKEKINFSVKKIVL